MFSNTRLMVGRNVGWYVYLEYSIFISPFLELFDILKISLVIRLYDDHTF